LCGACIAEKRIAWADTRAKLRGLNGISQRMSRARLGGHLPAPDNLKVLVNDVRELGAMSETKYIARSSGHELGVMS
jgi:predicted RNA-binding Zn ribbon-like protein